MTPSPGGVLVEGPWHHRTLTARGTRFHVAEIGTGPTVLFLHGFPEFWWAWRHQLVSFAEAGYRAVAMDLRGYGASDHAPRGYDLPSLAADVDAVIRSLGIADAVVVGHDWGGLIGWTLAQRHPKAVRRLVAVGAAHPRHLRRAVLTHPSQLRHSSYALGFQLPWYPERRLVADDAALVEALLNQWSAPGWPDHQTAARYRAALQVGNSAYCALEYHRWAVRSLLRPDGLLFARAMTASITAPVLHVHGAQDTCVLPSSAQGSSRNVDAPYRWRLLDGVGHFPHEEAPERFDREVLDWLADDEPDR